MLAILFGGIAGYRLLPGERPAERRLPDPPGHREPARAPAPRRWPRRSRRRSSGSSRPSPASTSMTSANALGATPDHAAVQPRRATSTPPRRTCRRRSRRRRRSCRPSMPTPPSYQKVNPADQPILFLALTSPTLPLSDGRRVRRDADRAAHLDGERRRAGAGLRLAEVRGAHPARPARARQPRHRHRRGRSGRRSSATSTCRPARSAGRDQAFTVQATGQLDERRGLPAADRRLPQRLAGAARGARAA